MLNGDGNMWDELHGVLLEMKRWNTPTIYNGWEQITALERTEGGFNREETVDFMPQMGPMIGFAVTLKFEPSNAKHPEKNPNAWSEYRRYVASLPGPKIVVVQDLDKPNVMGAFWGEVNSNIHRALGCVGTITDGAIRDVDEMANAGFKALAKRLCVGHAYSTPVDWGCEVEVFGTKIKPGQIIHADKHGFMAIEDEMDPKRLLDAARFMDTNECKTVIRAGRTGSGKAPADILQDMDEATAHFNERARRHFGARGEW